jgi:hypothetical protein
MPDRFADEGSPAMTALDRMDQDLLDFLCICAEKRVRIVTNQGAAASVAPRLRDAQLIDGDSFEPFPWTLEAWRQRQANKTAAPPCAEPMGPPEPKAAGSGDAALCSDAGDQHAAGVVEAASPVPRKSNTKEASGTPRKGSSAAASAVARRISDRASIAEPAPDMLPRSASAHVSGAELAAEIEAFCLARGVAPSRFGKILLRRPRLARDGAQAARAAIG